MLAAGGDALCRARARASWRDPDDAEAAERATRELLRRGAPVPRELLAWRPTLPSRVLDVDVPLRVFVERPDGRVELVGATPQRGGVHIPEHVRWWVVPWGPIEADALVRAIHDHAIAGLDLESAALVGPVLAAAPPSLRRLGLFTTRLEDGVLRTVGALPALDALLVRVPPSGRGFDDHDLVTVLAGTRLRELSLSGVSVEDDGLAALAGQVTLRRLELEGLVGFTGRGLRHVARLPHLEQLSLRACESLDDDGLLELAPARSLRRLSVPDVARSEGLALRWLAQRRGLGALEQLELGGARLAEEGLDALPELPRLSDLTLAGANLGDRAAELAGGVAGLRRLSLHGRGVTGRGLARWRGLERLDLGGADDSLAIMDVLRRSPGLVTLTLHRVAAHLALLRAIVGLERLESLALEASPDVQVRYAGLGRATRLERLRLTGSVDDDDVRGILRGRALRELDLCTGRLSSDGIRSLGRATALRRLVMRSRWQPEWCSCCDDSSTRGLEKELAIQELRRDLQDCDVEVTYGEGPTPTG